MPGFVSSQKGVTRKMLRIVGLQRNEHAIGEFLLLQNQGSMRVSLRGHAVISEKTIFLGKFDDASHTFADDIMIAPGQYVLLFTGEGTPRWAKTRDGATVYHAYMGRNQSVWSNTGLPIHVLGVQHSYIERPEPSLLLK